MTLYQFNKLKEADQLDVLLSHGAIVARRNKGIYRYVLYQVDNIYIELKYCGDYKTMPDIRGFTITSQALKVYLDDIDLSGL